MPKVEKIKESLSSELRLLLLLVRREVALAKEDISQKSAIKEAVQQVKDWENFIYLVNQHRVYPLAYQAVTKLEGQIPLWVMEKLKNMSGKNRMDALRQTGEMAFLAQLFAQAEISVIFVKSPHLAQWLYGDIALRPSHDLDFYINQEDLKKAIHLLQKEGYQPLYGIGKKIAAKEKKTIKEIHHIGFYHQTKKVQVELHWRLTIWELREAFSFQEMLSNSRKKQIAGVNVTILSSEDQFVFLVYHGCNHAWFRLRWLADIAELLKEEKKIDWKLVAQKIKEKKLEKMLGQALSLCSALFEVDLEQWPKEIQIFSQDILNSTSQDLALAAMFFIQEEEQKLGRLRQSWHANQYCFVILPGFAPKVNFCFKKIGRIPIKLFKEIVFSLWKIEL